MSKQIIAELIIVTGSVDIDKMLEDNFFLPATFYTPEFDDIFISTSGETTKFEIQLDQAVSKQFSIKDMLNHIKNSDKNIQEVVLVDTSDRFGRYEYHFAGDSITAQGRALIDTFVQEVQANVKASVNHVH